MPDLPSGTVTFLFTDIKGSTTLWERDRAGMATAVEPYWGPLGSRQNCGTRACGDHENKGKNKRNDPAKR
jgi:hypothetical protein